MEESLLKFDKTSSLSNVGSLDFVPVLELRKISLSWLGVYTLH